MPMTFFVIEAEGFTFGVLGLLVAVFQQLDQCISCILPLSFYSLSLVIISYTTQFYLFISEATLAITLSLHQSVCNLIWEIRCLAWLLLRTRQTKFVVKIPFINEHQAYNLLCLTVMH